MIFFSFTANTVVVDLLSKEVKNTRLDDISGEIFGINYKLSKYGLNLINMGILRHSWNPISKTLHTLMRGHCLEQFVRMLLLQY
jgi:hypothetical protein